MLVIHFCFFAFLLLFMGVFQPSLQQDPRLPSFGPFESNIASVSGFSSGGALSFQYYLSHSSELRGVGIFSGLMYECGLNYNSEPGRLFSCIRSRFNYTEVVKKIENQAAEGNFDPLINLKSRRHYISHGSPDPLVGIEEGNRIHRFFTEKSSQVSYNKTQGGHGYPTPTCGPHCNAFPTTSGCLRCGWSGAFESLNYIYGENLIRPIPSVLTECNPNDRNFTGLMAFDQREFFPSGTDSVINMGKRGYIYVPPQCIDDASKCTLHIHIHGCGQQESNFIVGTIYIKCSGIMAVAEANNIIVLFPQADFGIRSISNLLQCWDFVGYTGKNYGTKKGPQIQAIKGMFDRILLPRDATFQWTPFSTDLSSILNSFI